MWDHIKKKKNKNKKKFKFFSSFILILFIYSPIFIFLVIFLYFLYSRFFSFPFIYFYILYLPLFFFFFFFLTFSLYQRSFFHSFTLLFSFRLQRILPSSDTEYRMMALHELGQDGHLFKRQGGGGNGETTVSQLLSTVIPAFVIAVIFVIIFIAIRRSHPRTYYPRTYLGILHRWQKTPKSPMGVWNWIVAMYKLPDIYVLQHHSLDSYLFLRYTKILTVICFVGCWITWPILFPINATGKTGMVQLEILSITNSATTPARYFGHCFAAWAFVCKFLILTLVVIPLCSHFN